MQPAPRAEVWAASQWLNIHSFEALPEVGSEPTDTEPLGCRYDDMIGALLCPAWPCP